MTTRSFLIVTAIVEIGVGLFLVVLPRIPLALLLGIDPSAPELLLVGRWVGGALLAIGVTSAIARDAGDGPALRGVLAGVLVYDVAAALLLAYAGAGLHLAGPALWPAVVLHTLLAAWGVLSLRPAAAP